MSHTLHKWRSVLWWQLRSLAMRQPSAEDIRHRLRLVLGVGRSGTTWIARVLGHTSTPTQLVQEPLFRFRPRLNLSSGGDHVAIGPTDRLPARHRLMTAYRCLLRGPEEITRMGIGERVERADSSPQKCIAKEVHGLLAAEAVIGGLGCPTALVLRDPVMTVDSILLTNGFRTVYLQAEARHLIERATEQQIGPGFGRLQTLARGLISSARRRQRIVLRLAFAVTSIHLLFRRLDSQYPWVRLLRYEDLCRSGKTRFPELASDWGLCWDDAARRYLEECSAPPRSTSPYETRRVAEKQIAKSPAVLRPRDVAACKRLIELSGCSTPESHAIGRDAA